jgi:hypothetical protein
MTNEKKSAKGGQTHGEKEREIEGERERVKGSFCGVREGGGRG